MAVYFMKQNSIFDIYQFSDEVDFLYGVIVPQVLEEQFGL